MTTNNKKNKQTENIFFGKCWDCAYQDLTGNTFLGKCLWFPKHGLLIKEIPPEKIDTGCKFFTNKKE